MIYTQHLYIEDEVVGSAMITFMRRSNYDKFVFFVKELYNSGLENSWKKLLHSCVYEFCVLTNTAIESCYKKHLKQWDKTKSFDSIEPLLQALWRSSQTLYAFALLFFYRNETNPPCVIRYNELPSWTEAFAPAFRQFATALYNVQWESILYYIRLLHTHPTYKTILKEQFDLFIQLQNKKTPSCFLYKKAPYEYSIEEWIVIIAATITKKPVQSVKSLPKTETFQYETPDTSSLPQFHKISVARKYAIEPNVSLWNVERSQSQDETSSSIYDEPWYNHIYDCPLWRTRLVDSNIPIVDGKADLSDETNQEEFLTQYDFDLDEQKEQVRQYALPKLVDALYDEHMNAIVDPEVWKKVMSTFAITVQ